MEDRLKKYFDSLFEDAPDTKEVSELKEEIFCNTIDRYNDLLTQGKSEEASFTQAIARIGDIDELISFCNINRTAGSETYYSDEYMQNNIQRRNRILIITMIIYLICAIVPIALYGTSIMLATMITVFGISIATGLALYGINLKIDPEIFSRAIDSIKNTGGEDYSVEDFEKKRKFNNKILSAAVSLFLLSPMPIFFLMYLHEKSQPGVGTVMMSGNAIAIITIFILAVSIGFEMFYKANKLDIRRFSSSTMVEDFKTWNRINSKGNGIVRILDVIIFLLATFIFIIGGIKTNSWAVLSLNFAIAFVITQIIRQFFELAKISKK